MARQVRPWLVKPEKYHAPRVHSSDGDPTSEFHQGQRVKLANKVRMHGCNLHLQTIIERELGKLGASMHGTSG
jgi:hypothetical protein